MKSPQITSNHLKSPLILNSSWNIILKLFILVLVFAISNPMLSQVQNVNTTVGTPSSSAIGENTTANGNFSFAGGENSMAGADNSFAFGRNNNAITPFAAILGSDNTANGDFSYIFGNMNNTSSSFSYAFGENLNINSNYSFALGQIATINSSNSYILGSNASAEANNSYLFGTELESSASATNSFVLGSGITGNRLINTTSNSFMMGFNSNLPTLFVSGATGANTTGNIGIATITPGSKLQVNGNAAIGYSTATTTTANGLAVSGNVGIGTNNPLTKLQVNGNTAIGYTAAPSNGLAVLGKVGIGVSSPTTQLQINGNAAIGYSAAIYNVPANGVSINGDLGVGVALPYGKVEIKQTVATIPTLTLNVHHAPNTSILKIATDQNDGNATTAYPFLHLLEITTGSQFINGTYPSNPHTLDFKLKNNTALLITGGGLMVGYNDDVGGNNSMPSQYPPSDGMMVQGNVGIGMYPNKKLSVDGDILASSDLFLGDDNGENFGIIKNSSISVLSTLNQAIVYDYSASTRSEFNFYTDASGAFNFIYHTENKPYLFTITTGGKVGINQPEPQATLHIVEEEYDADPDLCIDAIRVDAGPANDRHPHFLVKSNGFVYAREINVQLSNLPTFPDYVFSKDYTLLSLEEVEIFINKYSHLPEVPSATEAEENGINMGEMNIVLLKKVEELTLHIIELNKRLKALENNNAVNEITPSGN